MEPALVCKKLRDYCDSHRNCQKCPFNQFCTFEGINRDGNMLGDYMNDAYLKLLRWR